MRESDQIGLGLAASQRRGSHRVAAAACLLAGLCVTQRADASIIASEGFGDYSLDATGSPTADNVVDGNTGGTGWGANAWAGDTDLLTVDPGTPLSFAVVNASSTTVGTVAGGNRASRFNVNTNSATLTVTRTLAASTNANELWGRALVRVEAGLVQDNDFLSFFFGGTTAPNFGIFGSSNATGDFFTRNGSTGVTIGGPNIAAGNVGVTNYLVVARILKRTPGAASNYDRIELWVNPVLDAANNLTAPTSAGDFTGVVSSFATVGIRNANMDADDVFLADEFQFGTTVSDVVPGAVGVVPEPTSAGLLGLAVLGTLARRGRRTPR